MPTRQDPEQIEARRAVAAFLVRAGLKGKVLDYGLMETGEENDRGGPAYANVEIYPSGEARDRGDFIPWDSTMLTHFIDHIGEAIRHTEEVGRLARCEAKMVSNLASEVDRMEVVK